MLIPIYQDHNNKIEDLISNGYAYGTLECFKISLKHLQEFLLWKYNISDISINKIDFAFVTEFEFYLRSIKKCSNSTAVKYVRNFRKIIKICLENDWLEKNPCSRYEGKMKEVERDFLTEEELQKIYNKRFSSERLQLVKDIFFLSCYAGLAYVDVKGLKKDHVGIGIDGEKWIFKNLQNEPDSTYKKINIQLERRLKNNCHHLDYLLFFPKRKTEKPQIIITANGNPLYFSYVENLVKAAPKIKNMNTNLIA